MSAINNVRISNNAKLYVPFVTLSINDNIKLLENIRQGFKWKISWNKYKSEIATQPKRVTEIIWLIRHLGTLIDCLYFHSKMVMMILH